MRFFSSLTVVTALFLAGCANTDFRAPSASSEFALVKSRVKETEKLRDSLVILAVDSVPVDPGFFRASTDMAMKVDPGTRSLVFRLVRSTGFWGRPLQLTGDLRFDAQAGRSYVLNTGELRGEVEVWVEDEESKERVSEGYVGILTTIPVQGTIPIIIPI